MTSAPTSTLPVPASEGAAGLTSAEVHTVASADDEAHSPDTHRAYSSQLKQWATWADERGFPSLPAAPAHIAAYLVVRAESSSPATVRASRADIGHQHRAAGLADPTGHIGVRRVGLASGPACTSPGHVRTCARWGGKFGPARSRIEER